VGLIFLDLVRARATVARDGAGRMPMIGAPGGGRRTEGVAGDRRAACGMRARFGVGARGWIGGGIYCARDARVCGRVRWARARCGGVAGRRGLRVLGLGAREGVGRRGKDSIALRVCGGCSCVAFACTDDVCLCFIGVSLTFGVEQEQGKWTMIRHGKKNPKLNRPADQRKALIRGLTTELLRHGTVTTTMARAKAIRKPVENMIQLAKDGDDYKRRMAESFIYDKEVVNALFEQAPTRYADRNGGYTRIVRTLSRRGDNATMGVIRLV